MVWVAWLPYIPYRLTKHILTMAHHEEAPMAWKTPQIVEISLGCEINSYASAEIKA